MRGLDYIGNCILEAIVSLKSLSESLSLCPISSFGK